MIAVVVVLSFLAGISALMAVMAVIEPDTTAGPSTTSAPVAARVEAPMEAEPAVARVAA